eukprot:TRINITY_DN2998_c0_g1_i2.p1 TRINITY_DN2998_c0_g1~~TRINITY_DN2998_c0_g1_i2.p1  ORF type:complete len:169 (+),score=27.55 TRINITY_DN2998_c0_g1_i2:38-544(+)
MGDYELLNDSKQHEHVQTYNLVVVGDGSVGKTCLLVTYTSGNFPHESCPMVFENDTTLVKTALGDVKLSLKDTAGLEDFARTRRCSYHLANIFLVCFSVVNTTSFHNVESWIEDIRTFGNGTKNNHFKILVVGTKIDLRNNPKFLATGRISITYEDVCTTLCFIWIAY